MTHLPAPGSQRLKANALARLEAVVPPPSLWSSLIDVASKQAIIVALKPLARLDEAFRRTKTIN